MDIELLVYVLLSHLHEKSVLVRVLINVVSDSRSKRLYGRLIKFNAFIAQFKTDMDNPSNGRKEKID